MAKANQAIAEMTKAQAEATQAQNDTSFQKYRDMMEAIPEGAAEEAGGSTMDVFLEVIGPHIPALLSKFTQGQPTPQVQTDLKAVDNNPGGGASQLAAPAEPIEPSKQLNQILGALDKLPEAAFTAKMVKTICKQRGIDQTLLKNVVKKLNGI